MLYYERRADQRALLRDHPALLGERLARSHIADQLAQLDRHGGEAGRGGEVPRVEGEDGEGVGNRGLGLRGSKTALGRKGTKTSALSLN